MNKIILTIAAAIAPLIAHCATARLGDLGRNSLVVTNIPPALELTGGSMQGPIDMGFNTITFNGAAGADVWQLWDLLRVWPAGETNPTTLSYMVTNAISEIAGELVADAVGDGLGGHVETNIMEWADERGLALDSAYWDLDYIELFDDNGNSVPNSEGYYSAGGYPAPFFVDGVSRDGTTLSVTNREGDRVTLTLYENYGTLTVGGRLREWPARRQWTEVMEESDWDEDNIAIAWRPRGVRVMLSAGLTAGVANPFVTRDDLDHALEGFTPSSGGVSDYSGLSNKPSINGHELNGAKDGSDYGLVNVSDLPGASVASADQAGRANVATGLGTTPGDETTWRTAGALFSQLDGKRDRADSMFSDLTVGELRKEGDVGTGSFAQGTNIVASGGYASAQGDTTVASGYAAHAEGTATVASGRAAHAEGCTTVASGNCAHTEGRYTKATGTYSHASGVSSVASNDHSFVWSANLPASNPNDDANKYGSHGKGTFNVNPDGGAEGFFVGSNSLPKVIADNALAMFTIMQRYGIDAAAEEYTTRIVYEDDSVEERLVTATFQQLTRRAKSVKIGRITWQIDQAAFYNQSSLESVTLSEDLVTIGPYAFMSSSLGSLELPSTVTNIWANAFADSSLTNVTFIGKTIDEVRAMANYPWGLPGTAFSVRKTATETWVEDLMDSTADDIRDEVDVKVSEAFAGNSPFRTETSTLVGFSDGSYEQFDWSGSVTHDVVVSAGLKNSDYSWAREVTSISFGTAVTDVGTDAFSYSPTLTNVVVGTSVATVQELAFGSHSALEPTFALQRVSIPPSVTGIGSDALGLASSQVSTPKVLFYGRTEDGLPSAINGVNTATVQGKYSFWSVGYLPDGTYDVEFPSIMNPVAYRSEVPTKVSQLDNDAAYTTAPVVTNIVRTIIATSGQYMWDEESSVCYRLNVHDGFIDLVAVTNINVNLPGNEEALLAVEEAWRNR